MMINMINDMINMMILVYLDEDICNFDSTEQNTFGTPAKVLAVRV